MDRGRRVAITVDGRRVECHAGETVATAILATAPAIMRAHGRSRSVFCGIGACYECVVEADGEPGVRACVTEVRDGLEVRTTHTRGPAA